jgi:hypothetical protein
VSFSEITKLSKEPPEEAEEELAQRLDISVNYNERSARVAVVVAEGRNNTVLRQRLCLNLGKDWIGDFGEKLGLRGLDKMRKKRLS